MRLTNTELLEQYIRDSGYKRSYIAKTLGLSPYALAHKIHNRSEFKSSEISALCLLLGIETLEKKEAVFFAQS